MGEYRCLWALIIKCVVKKLQNRTLNRVLDLFIRRINETYFRISSIVNYINSSYFDELYTLH